MRQQQTQGREAVMMERTRTRKRRREAACTDDATPLQEVEEEEEVAVVVVDQQRCAARTRGGTGGGCPNALSAPPHVVGFRNIDEIGKSYFFVHINGRLSRVETAAPFINTKQLFGQPGVLLQDVTVRGFPILLLPCPHTGNVTVQPRRRYNLMKFVGEHLCLAGDFVAVTDDDDDDDNVVARACSVTEDDMRQQQKPYGERREAWAMNEMMGMVDFLRHHPHCTPKNFQAMAPQRAALHHARGSVELLQRCGVGGSEMHGANSDHDTDDDKNEINEEEDFEDDGEVECE